MHEPRTKLAQALYPDCQIETFDDLLYHGCSRASLANRAQNGLHPYWHSMLEADYFCTSNSMCVIAAFGRGFGLCFDLSDRPLRIAVPTPVASVAIMAIVTADEPNIEAIRKVDPSISLDNYGEMTRCGRRITITDLIKEIVPQGVDAFALPSWLNDDYKSESELVIMPHSLQKLELSIAGAYINNHLASWSVARERLLEVAFDLAEYADEWTLGSHPVQKVFSSILSYG